jgi:hypothetical protein
MNTSRNFSTMLEKIAIMHLWKVAEALHNPKGMRQYAKCQRGR